MILKNIKDYTKALKQSLKERNAKLKDAASLAIIQVGDNEASNRYVRNKIKDCQEVGIVAHNYWYSDDITTEGLRVEVEHLADHYSGIIIQLPLPDHIDVKKVQKSIPPRKDVDGFLKDSHFEPATPKGIMDYLRHCDFDLTGKNVIILGRSEIVGKPLARMMTDADATVTLCHSKSKVNDFLSRADLIVSAVGRAGVLNCYPIYVPVIDVGINFVDGKMVGDAINVENRDVTPVPGGVGLLTRCALLENVIKAQEMEEK